MKTLCLLYYIFDAVIVMKSFSPSSEGGVWTGVWKTACRDRRFQYKYFLYEENSSYNDCFGWLGTYGMVGSEHVVNRFLNLGGKSLFKTCSVTCA